MKRKSLFLTLVFIWMLSFVLLMQNMEVYAQNAKTTQEINDLLKKWKYPDIAFYYENLDTGVQLYYNPHKGYYPCCTVKIKGILNLYDKARNQEYNLDSKLTYTKANFARGSGYIVHRGVNKQYSLAQLAEYSIRHSDNAAYIMTQRFMGRKIYSVTSSDERSWSAFQTAQELKRLYQFLQTKDRYSQDLMQYFTTTKFNNSIPAALPKEYKVAHKTGDLYDPLLDHDAAIVFAPSPYILNVFTKGLPSFDKAAQFTRELTGLVEVYNNRLTAPATKELATLNERAKKDGYVAADMKDFVLREKTVKGKELVKMAIQAIEKLEQKENAGGSQSLKDEKYYIDKGKALNMIFADFFPTNREITREVVSVVLSKAYFGMMNLKKEHNVREIEARNAENPELVKGYLKVLEDGKAIRTNLFDGFEAQKEFLDFAKIERMYLPFVKQGQVYGFLPKLQNGNYMPKNKLTVGEALQLIYDLEQLVELQSEVPQEFRAEQEKEEVKEVEEVKQESVKAEDDVTKK